MSAKLKADIGIFGGSGLYSLFEKSQTVRIKTPYGAPSAPVTIAEISGKKIAFLPRHGLKHQFPPHKVPYKANIHAFKQLGVKTIISPCAAGSLSARVKPGDFVILDQFVDRTKGRDDTYFHGPTTAHIAGADPYCQRLRQVALKACRRLKIKTHPQGTVVVVNGPRFSTAPESKFYMEQGWQVINMTQYPEVVLAREQEICFLGVALITDFDIGLAASGKVKPVDMQEVLKVFNQNVSRSRDLIFEIIKSLPDHDNCACRKSLEDAIINH